jgi:hypothetical protein
MKKTVLIICNNHLNKAPRFLMEVEALKSDFSIIAAGLAVSKINNDFQFVQLATINNSEITFHANYPKLIRKFFSFIIKYFYKREFTSIHKFENKYNSKESKNELKKLGKLKFELIVTHHLDSLPMAVRLSKSKNVPLVFNAHEYYPRQFESRLTWIKYTQPEYLYIANKYLPQVNQMLTVCEGIKKEYKKSFGVDSEVIYNSKKYYPDLNPSLVNESAIRMVHHGVAIRERHLEEMIKMMEFLPDNYELTLILFPTQIDYYEELKSMASDSGKIVFEDIVDVDQIVINLNRFDIGLYILKNSSFNHEYALPNKVFEFVQARLCLAISPNKEMKRLVDKYDLGVVSEDFTAKTMANRISALSLQDIQKYKNNSHLNAKELGSESSELTILNEVKRLL